MSETTAWDVERKWLKEFLKKRVVKMCAAGLVGGRAHAEYLEQLGIERTKIFFGYDAVDNDYFAAKAEEVRSQSSVVRSQQRLPDKYFLASARFIEKKNLPRLIEAYARYRVLAQKAEMLKTETLKSESSIPSTLNPQPSTEPWSLVLLGDGPLRSTLNSQLSTLNLHGHVLLPGFKQYGELPVYYGLASAFIHASTTEQWGLVVNEAMASGLPVLVSNRCGCAADLVQEGVNGFTFDPYNVEQLAELMFQISLRGVGSSGPEAAFNFPLSAFGSESQRIISQWGPERFARGLHDAVQTALKNPASNASLMDRLILRLLMAR
jgi:glycosyltransferase involved in cell wall biosynthesis